MFSGPDKRPVKSRVSIADFQRGQNIPEPPNICAKLVTFREGRKEGDDIFSG